MPAVDALDRAVDSLQRKNNLRLLIGLVEAWNRTGDVTVSSRLAQVRALQDLCATERAWARLLPLLDQPANAEVYRLAGSLLTEQGRAVESATVLRQGLERFPSHGGLTRELERTEPGKTQVDRTDPVANNIEGRVRLAEHHLRSGAQLRAKTVLERVLKQQPDHPRASDLLWCMEGDFELQGVRLKDLVRVHSGPRRVAELSAIGGSFENERTEAAGLAHLSMLEEPKPPSKGFPSLFKNLDALTSAIEAPIEDEKTAFARTVDDAPKNPVWTGEDERLETQIQRVVHRPRPAGPDGVDTLIEKGDSTPDAPAVTGDPEDEDVVVRRPTFEPLTAAETEPMDVLRLQPERDRLPDGVSPSDEGADFVRPRKRPVPKNIASLPTNPEDTPEPVPMRAPELLPASLPPPLTDEFDLDELYPGRRMSWTGWLIVGMLIGAMLLAGMGLTLLAGALVG